LSELCQLVTQSVIERERVGEPPLILNIEVEIANEDICPQRSERLAVVLPALATIEVGEVAREVADGGVGERAGAVEESFFRV
jgi:hypothetical protein